MNGGGGILPLLRLQARMNRWGGRMGEEFKEDPRAAITDLIKGGAHSGGAGILRLMQGLIPGEQPDYAAGEELARSLIPTTEWGRAGAVPGGILPELNLLADAVELSRIPGYWKEGQFGLAGLSALGAIPVIGTPLKNILKGWRATRKAKKGIDSIPTRFTTGRGSRYTTGPEDVPSQDRVQTLRERISDETGIRSLQSPSQRTYYIDPKEADRLGLAIQGNQPHVLATHPDMPGHVAVRSAGGPDAGKWNPGMTHPSAGNWEEFLKKNDLVDSPQNRSRFMEEAFVPYESRPREGLMPVESWIDPDLPLEELIAEAAKRRRNTAHFGSPIDRVLREGERWPR